MTLNDDVDDYWSTDKWGDGIQWDDAHLAWKEADKVTEKGYGSTRQDCPWKEYLMIVCAEEKACYVWNS